MNRVIAFICILFVLTACRADPLTRAKEQVSIGTSREEAVKILSNQAWYYEPCWLDDTVAVDLFFFGDHHYDKADIVIVTSRRTAKTNGYQVEQIGSYEPYLWHTSYEDCIQRNKFED